MTIGGVRKIPEYRSWRQMKQRCLNPNYYKWHRYGGRGIKISARWVNSFKNFYADMGPRPSPTHSLDRICNWGSYGPSNCKWSTKGEQARNRHTNLKIEYRGKRMCLAEACELAGAPYKTAQNRIKKGLPFDIPVRVLVEKLSS